MMLEVERRGFAATVSGVDLSTDLADGVDATALVRPEALKLEAGDMACIRERRLRGSHVVIEIAAADHTWRAHAPANVPGGTGEHVDVTLDPRLVHIVANG